MNQVNVTLNTKDPKREREQKHVNLADDTVANIETANIHHLGKGLIPLYTVLNSQSVNRAYHYGDVPTSGAIEYSKKAAAQKEKPEEESTKMAKKEKGTAQKKLDDMEKTFRIIKTKQEKDSKNPMTVGNSTFKVDRKVKDKLCRQLDKNIKDGVDQNVSLDEKEEKTNGT